MNSESKSTDIVVRHAVITRKGRYGNIVISVTADLNAVGWIFDHGGPIRRGLRSYETPNDAKANFSVCLDRATRAGWTVIYDGRPNFG
ncbi:MAG: hypothetical protein ABI539_13160 [Acidobacteriota bacterium]